MNNANFAGTIENVRKHRCVKLVPIESRKNHLVSKPIYCTTKFFIENTLAIRRQKLKYLWVNVYLGLSIEELVEMLTYRF